MEEEQETTGKQPHLEERILGPGPKTYLVFVL